MKRPTKNHGDDHVLQSSTANERAQETSKSKLTLILTVLALLTAAILISRREKSNVTPTGVLPEVNIVRNPKLPNHGVNIVPRPSFDCTRKREPIPSLETAFQMFLDSGLLPAFEVRGKVWDRVQ